MIAPGTLMAGVTNCAAKIGRKVVSEHSVFIDAAGIATYCGRSIETVRYWERVGGVLPPSAKVGRRRVWKRSDIEAWADSFFAGAGA